MPARLQPSDDSGPTLTGVVRCGVTSVGGCPSSRQRAVRCALVGRLEDTEARLADFAEKPCLLALDGERERVVGGDDEAGVRVERDGPRVVDINGVVREAAAQGFFTVQERTA